MTGFEKLLLMMHSQGFIQFMILVLSVVVNVLLAEAPPRTFKELILNILKYSVFAVFVFLVFTPSLTPFLVSLLAGYIPGASEAALSQLAFGIIVLMSQQVILFAKGYFIKKAKDYDTKGKA